MKESIQLFAYYTLRWWRSLFLILPFVLLNSGPAFSQSTGRWFTRAPLPTPRQEIPHAVLEGKIYIPGGFLSGGVATNIVEAFQPASNTWNTIPSLPLTMHHLAFAAVNGKLYVLGGYTGNSFQTTDRVFEFDFTANQWIEKTAMPGARGAATAAVYGGRIYVIGGVNSFGAPVGTNQVYDPAQDSWQTLAPMPTPREHLASAVIDSLIYLVGGRNFSTGGGNTNKLEAYSPDANQWYEKAAMPTARGGLAAAALHGRLYAFGGEIPGVFSEVEEYDPAEDSWQNMTPMPTPRHGMGAATVEDTIFVIGGGPVAGFGVSDVNSGFTIPPPLSLGNISEVPQGYLLYQNYPNPFNNTTIIRFAAPVSGRVILEVFDVAGRKVTTLAAGRFDPGIHQVPWQTRGAPTGIYFYRLQTRDHSQTRKLLLIR